MVLYKTIRKKDGKEFMYVGTDINYKEVYISIDGKEIKRYSTDVSHRKSTYESVEVEITEEERLERAKLYEALKFKVFGKPFGVA